jgi:hypothetical protein
VTPQRVEELLGRIDGAGGPPPGVPLTGLQILVDESQQSAVVLQFFATIDDLRAAEEVFAAMDPSETPGTRVSVDRCELKLDRRVPA